jgi:hypothetical protein
VPTLLITLSAMVARSSPASAASLSACTSTKARHAMSAMTPPLLRTTCPRPLTWPPANTCTGTSCVCTRLTGTLSAALLTEACTLPPDALLPGTAEPSRAARACS